MATSLAPSSLFNVDGLVAVITGGGTGKTRANVRFHDDSHLHVVQVLV